MHILGATPDGFGQGGLTRANGTATSHDNLDGVMTACQGECGGGMPQYEGNTIGGGAGIRTPDQGIMIPLLYR